MLWTYSLTIAQLARTWEASFSETLGTKKKDSKDEHECFSFETPQVSCSLSEFLELISLSTRCSYEDSNHLLILISQLFWRMVVDAFFTTNIPNPIDAFWY